LSATTELPEGWLTEAEVSVLQGLARNQLVLEIGSWLGRSTVAMAQVALHVVSVDHHRGSPEHEGDERLRAGKTLVQFISNLEEWKVRSKVSVCVLDSHFLRLFRSAQFDGVFVDGAHDFGSATRDGTEALRLVRTGGWVAFHDYHALEGKQGYPPVGVAVRTLLGGRYSIVLPEGTSLGIVRT